MHVSLEDEEEVINTLELHTSSVSMLTQVLEAVNLVQFVIDTYPPRDHTELEAIVHQLQQEAGGTSIILHVQFQPFTVLNASPLAHC